MTAQSDDKAIIQEEKFEELFKRIYTNINAVKRPPKASEIKMQKEYIREVLEKYVQTGKYPTFCGADQDIVDEYNQTK